VNGFGTTAACKLVVEAAVVLAALLCIGMARGEPVQAAGASAFGVPVEATAADRSFVLADVSCGAANSCIAVGNDNSASG
jgi:hypothetical protein